MLNFLATSNNFLMYQGLSLLRNFSKILKSTSKLKPMYTPRTSFADTASSLANRISRPISQFNNLPQVFLDRNQVLNRRMSDATNSVSAETEIVNEDEVEKIELLSGLEDRYGGVTVTIEQSMDSEDFALKLRASISKWRHKGKKGIWIKLPRGLANLVETAVKEGFRYHHAEPDYLMLVNWISNCPDTIPANASHRIGVGAFVLNDNKEVLAVKEKVGPFRGKDVWKLPTGVVNEGEDICAAAIREVKEETGIDTEFVEVLAFRQSHKSFFGKSDLLFVCMLRPNSLDIQKQDSEIKAAQWMPVQDYVDQPFNQENEMFNHVAKICLSKSQNEYSGFLPVLTATSSGKPSYLYCYK